VVAAFDLEACHIYSEKTPGLSVTLVPETAEISEGERPLEAAVRSSGGGI
jgi:hypothetical protein